MIKVTVEFPRDVPYEEGPYLLAMEQLLRAHHYDVQVFKARMGDDSKLRMALTPEERARV